MDGMRVRFEIKNLYLKVGNVSRNNESYVLLTAYDHSNNEIVLELTHEQAEFLEDQFFEANRRYEQRVFTPMVSEEQPLPNRFANQQISSPQQQGYNSPNAIYPYMGNQYLP
ncbi:hypothetical protein [Bacillus sp. CECT 9360]|uniref:hypothetical protein n=1 Tax=Bacillus sp. CECT 9360 TaxID=2845821 RepID=UPI001E29B987|nr:hypothetical protein [Bacillus sp. CECT 9360]CAH0345229.1 hypothetical protein BCI9360_01509 [Bacillus sp. CECT 9360]